jgi:Protein of unknown function (DUF1236)
MTYIRHAVIRHAAIAAALIGAGTASAQTTVITRTPVQTQTIVTEQPTVQLTPVQRQTIYRTVVREHPLAAAPTVEYRIGRPVPPTARLYAVPPQVAVAVPAVKTYKYMMVNDQIVLVDPVTSEVVAEIGD